MSLVTLRILDGPERGKAFRQIATPVSIGREEGNFIQLNDERVSRYHLKIHENDGAILLTDLQSTNGTRVNGEAVHVWRLRPGDIISLGRSVLIFGSTDEIAARLAKLSKKDQSASVPMGIAGEEFQFLERYMEGSNIDKLSSHLFEVEIFRGLFKEELAPLHLLAPPDPPTDLPPRQLAQLLEFLHYILIRLRYLTATVHTEPLESENGKSGKEDADEARVSLSAVQWQNLLDLYARIAKHLESVTES
ncbi:MAG: FHA domain-containing protein [Planctomycetaceae bacterium]|jgi:pSer/pThr/pTyr-binding forkhead associated (FHA) protein|nr:FHA domain-containing protein [Planctomycetaceae bacterium]